MPNEDANTLEKALITADYPHSYTKATSSDNIDFWDDEIKREENSIS